MQKTIEPTIRFFLLLLSLQSIQCFLAGGVCALALAGEETLASAVLALQHSAPSATRAFVAHWSFSETPLSVRRRLLNNFVAFDAWMLTYSPSNGVVLSELDNQVYFAVEFRNAIEGESY